MLFGLSQGQVSHWVGVLTPLVNAALGRELLLPARRPADLEKAAHRGARLAPAHLGWQRETHPAAQEQAKP